MWFGNFSRLQGLQELRCRLLKSVKSVRLTEEVLYTFLAQGMFLETAGFQGARKP